MKFSMPQVLVQELFCCLLLFCANFSFSHCLFVFYAMTLIGQIFNYLIVIGIEVQVKLVLRTSFLGSPIQIYIFSVIVGSLVFDILALCLAFQGYKLSKELYVSRLSNQPSYSPENE